MDGFFVRALFVMSIASWAAANNIPTFVDMEEVGYDHYKGLGNNYHGSVILDAYYDPSLPGDRWEQYFKPIHDVTKKEVYESVPESRINELSASCAWFYFNMGNSWNGAGVYPTTFAEAVEGRSRHAAKAA